MDLKTVMLMLAIGSLLFGLLLVTLRLKKNNPQRVPYWIVAKFLQAAGSLMLFYRTGTFDDLTMLANNALLLGCAYEAWAIRIISGQQVKQRLHIIISMGIILVCWTSIFLAVPYRLSLIFLLQSVFYFLPGVFLFSKSDIKSFLRLLLGVSYCITGSVFLMNSILWFGFPERALSPGGNALFGMIPVVSFCIFLMSGFIMLMLAKERSDMQVLEIQKTLEESNRQLAELSNKDGLTGIANRRCFDDILEHEYFRLKRSNSKLSIIMLDVDYFKAYNDYYGHVMGDECLRRIGSVLAGCINPSVDLAARYGGEEFACILPVTDIQSAVKIAEKIRQGIQELRIEHKESPVSEFITASFGVTTVQYSSESSLSGTIASVDKLMYKAKASGRNRIEFADLKGNEELK